MNEYLKENGGDELHRCCTGKFFEIPNKPTDTHSSGNSISS